jgi:hypothetical protein
VVVGDVFEPSKALRRRFYRQRPNPPSWRSNLGGHLQAAHHLCLPLHACSKSPPSRSPRSAEKARVIMARCSRRLIEAPRRQAIGLEAGWSGPWAALRIRSARSSRGRPLGSAGVVTGQALGLRALRFPA